MEPKKCSKCKKSLDISHFGQKKDSEIYATCNGCIEISRKTSNESYNRSVKKYKCEYCGKEYGRKYLRKHLWCVHNVGDGKVFNCDICEFESKNKSYISKHKWRVHNIGTGEIYSCPRCNYETKSKGDLDKHLWQFHDIGGKYLKCSECNQKYKTTSTLNQHLWQVHDVNLNSNKKIFECDICGGKFKANGSYEQHQWQVHSIGNGSYHKCHLCNYVCKLKGVLTRHLWHKHNIGKGKIHRCNQSGCEIQFKTGAHLVRHLWGVHNIGKGEIFKCDKCIYTTKNKSDLRKHLWGVHNIGKGEIFKCDKCPHTTKNKSDFRKHLSNFHDIGIHSCPLCLHNVYHLVSYTDPIKLNTIKICRKCYNKATGYSGRKEEQMVRYLQKHPQIGPYFVLKDQIIKGDVCQTKRRPDLYLSSVKSNLHILIECDESQHQAYPEKCERGRLDEIIDEIKEGRIFFIRWNPDYYRHKGTRGKCDRQQRLDLLRDLILYLVEKDDWEKISESPYRVYYMFYSDDREDLEKEFERVMIYDQESFETIKEGKETMKGDLLSNRLENLSIIEKEN